MGFCGYYIKTKKGRLVGGFIGKSAKEAKNSRKQGPSFVSVPCTVCWVNGLVAVGALERGR